jgi:hypothetical protein
MLLLDSWSNLETELPTNYQYSLEHSPTKKHIRIETKKHDREKETEKKKRNKKSGVGVWRLRATVY